MTEEKYDEIEEQGEDFEDSYNIEEDMKERAALREEEAAEDAKELAHYRKHTDESGSPKSLYDYYKLNEIEIPPRLPGGPRIEDYSADGIVQFELDCEAYRETGKLPNDLLPWPDDPYRATRHKIMAEVEEHQRKEAQWRSRGNRQKAELHAWHGRKLVEEFESLPPPPEVTYRKEMEDEQRKSALDMAFNDEYAEDEFWQSKRVQEDSQIIASQQIIFGDSNEIILPAETSPWSGECKKFVPENLLKFKLPENVSRQIRVKIKNKNAESPGEIFAVAWSVLHKLGYASGGIKSPAAKEPKIKKTTSVKKEPEKTERQLAYQKTVRPGMFLV